jgi:hypothetical protein
MHECWQKFKSAVKGEKNEENLWDLAQNKQFLIWRPKAEITKENLSS